MPGIEDDVVKVDTTIDPNAGKSMLDFVKSEVKLEAPKGDVQELSKTTAIEDDQMLAEKEKTPEQQEAERNEKAKLDREREELLANETVEEKLAREEKERLEKEQVDEEVVEEVVEKKDPVPYERFEEINNKYKVTVEEFEKIKPLAESHQQIQQYCEQYNITQDQFKNLLDVQRLLNTDPEKALAKIMPIVEAIQGFTGDKLPPDLQKEVDLSQISLERAREVAKLRAQSQFGATRFQQYQQMQQQKAQTAFQGAQVSAINAWIAGKKNDLDFQPRKDDNAPRGKFEFVYDAVQSMMAERDAQGNLKHVLRVPEDVTKLLEKAYTEVTRSLSPMQRKPATKKQLTQNGSGARNTSLKPEEAKTMGEAIRMAAAQHGL